MRSICVTTLDELADYEDSWEALRQRCGGSIFTSYGFSKIWLETFSDFDPQVIMIEDRGDLVGIAPLTIYKKRVRGIPVRTLSLIGDDTERLGFGASRFLFEHGNAPVLGSMIEEIEKLDWNILRMKYMEDSEATRESVQSIRSTWDCEEYPPVATITHAIPESGDVMDSFGKETRKKLRQRIRGLEREHQVGFRSLSIDDMDRAVEVYAQQHIERWESKGGSIFRERRNVEFLNRLMKGSMSNDQGFAHEMLIDDQVAAQQFGFLEEKLARGYMLGMNNAFAKYSPGMAVISHAMSDLRSRGYLSIDLGPGLSDYKNYLGGQQASLLGLQVNRGSISLISRVVKLLPSK